MYHLYSPLMQGHYYWIFRRIFQATRLKNDICRFLYFHFELFLMIEALVQLTKFHLYVMYI